MNRCAQYFCIYRTFAITQFTFRCLVVSQIFFCVILHTFLHKYECHKYTVSMTTYVVHKSLALVACSKYRYLVLDLSSSCPEIKTEIQGRVFSIRAPQLWNNLPEDLSLAQSITSFKSILNIYLLAFTFFERFYVM